MIKNCDGKAYTPKRAAAEIVADWLDRMQDAWSLHNEWPLDVDGMTTKELEVVQRHLDRYEGRIFKLLGLPTPPRREGY